MMTAIDVWNIDTFDTALLSELHSARDILRNYALTETDQSNERKIASAWVPYKSNPFAGEWMHFLEFVVVPAMTQRVMRAWHYTHLTDDETTIFRSHGVYTSDLQAIRRRLDIQAIAGTLSVEQADALFAASPFHQQEDCRSGRFWMVSHPVSSDDSGVELLLQSWGGEGVYFWLEDPVLIDLVKGFGRPRVIELAVPLRLTAHTYAAAKAVASTFVRALGCEADWSAFDLCTTSALAPDAVLCIHTEGEPNFAALARGYPAGFIDRD